MRGSLHNTYTVNTNCIAIYNNYFSTHFKIELNIPSKGRVENILHDYKSKFIGVNTDVMQTKEAREQAVLIFGLMFMIVEKNVHERYSIIFWYCFDYILVASKYIITELVK